MTRTWTHPDVLTIGVRDGWADPETDPTRIDWPSRQARALIPFEVHAGRPVNPWGPTGVDRGRNELGCWGEQAAADALVFAHLRLSWLHAAWRWITRRPRTPVRYALMVQRGDGYGWAVPGGMVDPDDETPAAAAVRELEEETGLTLPGAAWTITAPRHVPDPRESDEAWTVTVLCVAELGDVKQLPTVAGADDAARAAWVPAGDYATLAAHLAEVYGGRVFAAHVGMLADAL